NEKRSQGLLRLLLALERPQVLAGSELAGGNEKLADTLLEAGGLRVGPDDPASIEGDADPVLRRLDRQSAGLAMQGQHLEKIGHREVGERSLKPHGNVSRPARPTRARSPRRGRGRPGKTPTRPQAARAPAGRRGGR